MSSSVLGLYQQRMGPSPNARAWKYEGWKRGANAFAEDNEIRDDEFYEGINIEITGRSSIRLPRRGHRDFATVSGATNFNGWGILKNPKTSVNLLLSMWDGHLYKTTTSGSSSEIDGTKTWDSSATTRGVLLRDFFYFGNGVDSMSKTDGTTVTQWTEVTKPTLNSVTLSGTGTDTLYAYVITAVTDVGETEASDEITAYGPGTLSTTNKFAVVFARKTDSSVRGYNIYRAKNGGTLLLLGYIDQQSSGGTLTYTDDGTDTNSLIYEAPTFNTTGGIKGNIYAKYANTLFISGNDDEPDTVFYGGTGALWESFSPDANGGWVKPGRGDGERVTAMIGFEDFLFIFKENSIWKFTFGDAGAPSLVAVIPQYGTSSPDTVWRFERDIMYLGSDGRIRILGYEPTQLNVIRTTDISNRIQPRLDVLDKTNINQFFSIVYEQKYIICDGTVALPYDRRYIGFLDKWTNYSFNRFIVWDRGTNQQKLFGATLGGKIQQLLVDNTYDDNGTNINASLRIKRVDGGEDTILKYFYFTRTKFKNPKGSITLYTYKDGATLVDTSSVEFSLGGGIDEYMFDEPMFDESISITSVSDAIQILKKDLYFEAYSIYHQINIIGSENNHCIVQSMNGVYEVEDYDYERDETKV